MSFESRSFLRFLVVRILLSFRLLFPFFIALLVFLTSCAGPERKPSRLPGHPAPYKIGKRWYRPMKHSRGFQQRGMASWYGKKFHGRKTSNGEIYNMYAMTGAHKTLPLGTYIRVHNLRNGKKAVIRINDRGPFIRGRIVDLSYTAAKKIGLVGPGTAPVKIVALGVPQETVSRKEPKRTFVPVNYYVGDFVVQVGAFKERVNAIKLKNKLAPTYKDVHIATYESMQGTFYRVRVARCTTLDEARRYEKMLERDGFPDAIVVAR